LHLGLKFIANILENLPRSAEEIAGERQIFRHELTAAAPQADRDAVLERYWRATLGDPNWKIGRKRQLWRINRLQPDSINSFKSIHYRPANAALSIVGPIAADELSVALERLTQMPPVDVPADSSPKRKQKKLRQVTLSVDVFGYAWIYLTHIVESADPITRLTAQVVANLLGGGPHSELFRRLRMERQLAYAVYADDLHYLRRTAIYSHTTVASRSVREALRFILEAENNLATRGLTADQLEFARRRLSRGHELQMDYPDHLAAYLAYEALRPPADALLEPDGYLEQLLSLTLAQANTAAATLLSPSNRFSFIGGRLGPFSRFRIRRSLRPT
jgi:zinc protease